MSVKAEAIDIFKFPAPLDCVQTNIFIADLDFNLVYMNPLAEKTLKSIKNEIFEVFGVRVENFIGESIHQFHRDPNRVEKILRNPLALPHEAMFDFGLVHLKTSINGVTGPEGEIIGYVVNWEDVSEKVRLDMEMAQLVIELDQIENRKSS